MASAWQFIRPFESLNLDDVPLVGGKHASFGEMISALGPLGVRVPDGFALTADAYRALVGQPGVASSLHDARAGLDTRDVDSLRIAGAAARKAIRDAPLPSHLVEEIEEAYLHLSRRSGEEETDVAVRSSATAEDQPAHLRTGGRAVCDEDRFAAADDVDLVVMGNRRRASSLGSLAQRVVTSTRQRVLVVH